METNMKHDDFCARHHESTSEFALNKFASSEAALNEEEQSAHALIRKIRNAGVPVKLHEGEITPEGYKLIRKLSNFLSILSDHAMDVEFGYEVRPVRLVKLACPSPSEQSPYANKYHQSEPSQ